MKKSSKISLTVLLILAMCFNVLSPVFATAPQNDTDAVDTVQQDTAEPKINGDEALPADEKTDAPEEEGQNTQDTVLPEAVLEDESAQAEVENAVEDTLTIKTMPSESVFDKLWIGDSVGIKGFSTIKGIKVNTEFQVIKGDGVKVFDEWNEKFKSNLKGLLFTKAEDAVVKVLFKNKDTQALIGEKVYNFKITERTKAVEIIPDTKSYQIGERFSNNESSYAFKNMNYSGLTIDIYDGEIAYSRYEMINGYTTLNELYPALNNAFYFHVGGDPYNGSLTVNDDRTGKPYYCAKIMGFFSAGDLNYDTTYVQPITGAKIEAPYTIKVEEPIIEDNAPQNVKIGNSINLNTELTNLVAKNRKVADVKEEEYNFVEIAFIPKVEIVEGQNLVTQSEQDYSNTLTSSEKLTFNKDGTVKLKIKYNEMATCGWCMLKDGYGPDAKDVDHRYNPEKIITINVVDKGVKAISMEKLPTKTEYVEATAFDPAGGKLKVDYDNETTETLDLSKANCTVDTNKPGESVPVIVEYGGVTTTFNIKVTPKSLEKIALTKDPQTQYLTGDALNLKGGELTLTYNNNTTQTLDLTDKDVNVTGYDKDKVGKQTLTITYKEKTTELKIEVISREALNKVVEMINEIDPDNLYESDRAMVYDAKNAYDKLGTNIEKAAVTNVETLNKAVALFEAPFYSEAVVNNTTITAKGDSNIFALKTRLAAENSALSSDYQQGVLKTLNSNPQLIGAYDFNYTYVEKDGKDQPAVLAKDKTVQYTLPLDTTIVGKKAINVVYINAKGEPTVLKSDYQNEVLSFESGQIGTFALILTDLPAPVDPTNPNGEGTNASINGNNPITGLLNSDNAVQSVIVILCVLLLACTSAFVSKKKQQ